MTDGCETVYAGKVFIQPYLVVFVSACLFRCLQFFCQTVLFPRIFPLHLLVKPSSSSAESSPLRWKTVIDEKKRKQKRQMMVRESVKMLHCGSESERAFSPISAKNPGSPHWISRTVSCSFEHEEEQRGREGVLHLNHYFIQSHEEEEEAGEREKIELDGAKANVRYLSPSLCGTPLSSSSSKKRFPLRANNGNHHTVLKLLTYDSSYGCEEEEEEEGRCTTDDDEDVSTAAVEDIEEGKEEPSPNKRFVKPMLTIDIEAATRSSRREYDDVTSHYSPLSSAKSPSSIRYTHSTATPLSSMTTNPQYNPYIPLFIYWQAFVAFCSIVGTLYLVVEEARNDESPYYSNTTLLSSRLWRGYQDFYGILLQSPACTFVVLCIETLSADHLHPDTQVYRFATLAPLFLLAPPCLTHIIPALLIYAWVWILAAIGLSMVSLLFVFTLYLLSSTLCLSCCHEHHENDERQREREGCSGRSTTTSSKSVRSPKSYSPSTRTTIATTTPTTTNTITASLSTNTLESDRDRDRKNHLNVNVYVMIKEKIFDISAGIFLRIFLILFLQTAFTYMIFFYQRYPSSYLSPSVMSQREYLQIMVDEFVLRLQQPLLNCVIRDVMEEVDGKDTQSLMVVLVSNILVYFNWL